MRPVIIKILKNGLFSLIALGIVTLSGLYLTALMMDPPDLNKRQTTIYYDQNEEVISKEHGPKQRSSVELSEISPHVTDAIIASEDKDFYQHNGFDIKRILSAALTDLKNLSLKEGASTITQQYARNAYLSHDKTWRRKSAEAFYTMRLEMHYDKDTILENYLNTIYFGHGAYGIEAASEYFFDKKAADLSLAEAAMLAGIPKGPKHYSPFHNRDNAKQRQARILNNMQEEDMISQKERYLAEREKLNFEDPDKQTKERIAPHFLDTALKETAHLLDMDPEIVRSSGYRIYTTLDTSIQNKLTDAAGTTIPKDSNIEVGGIAMAPDSGSIRALIGGRSYDDSQFNRAIQAKRRPGSAFKPILYYAALENGYNARTRLMSKPTTFKLDNGEVYKPTNFNDYYAKEPITLAEALAVSDNIFAVKTNLFIGPDTLADTAERFGFDEDLPEVPSLALGTANVSIADMTQAYSMLANGGRKVESHTVEKVVAQDGSVVYDREDDKHDTQGNQVLDPSKTFILSDLMTNMFDTSLDTHMPVTGTPIANELNRPYAGKSGSTETDRWMMGYSPDLVTGIWNGYDDNRPIKGGQASRYVKDIWADFMTSAHKDKAKTSFNKPDDVVKLKIDPKSGLRATPYCDESWNMYFEKGTEPDLYCNLHMPKNSQEKPNKPKEPDDEKNKFRKWFESLFGL